MNDNNDNQVLNNDDTKVVDNGAPAVEETPEEKAIETADKKGAVVTDNGSQVNQNQTQKTDDKDKTEDDKADVEDELNQQRQAEKDVKADLAGKGVDFDVLSKEYEENGSLSEASMKALADAGYPKSVVDAYIRGMEATAEKYVNTVIDMAGGKEAFKQMTDFIASMGQPEINAFNQAIEEGNLSQLQVMFDGYHARMVSKYGTNNRSILGGSASGSMGRGFTTKNAMVKAMSDPKYDSDPEYRAKVQNMVMNSDFNNI